MKHIKKLFLLMLALSFPLCAISQSTITVTVEDNVFVPADITINEGDTVRWVWTGNLHNIVAGEVLPNNAGFLESGAFRSSFAADFEGTVYSLKFDRDFIVHQAPLADDNYKYYCEPHAAMGMIGSVKVNRVRTNFYALLQGSQVVNRVESEFSGTCNLSVDGQETTLSINCDHTVPGGIIEIKSGILQHNGAILCALPVGAHYGSCAIQSTFADDLFAGNVYVDVATIQFPKGQIRGQALFDDGGNGSHSIVGRVAIDDIGISGVLISAGSRNSLTDENGYYAIENVPNGIYELEASAKGYSIEPDKGTGFAQVNNADSYGHSFHAKRTRHAGSVKLVQPVEGSILSSFDVIAKVIVNGHRAKRLAVRIDNGDSILQDVKTSDFVITAKNGSHSIRVQALDRSNKRVGPDVIRKFKIRSPLTLENLRHASKIISLALHAGNIETIGQLLTELKALFGQMISGGIKNPELPTLSSQQIKHAIPLVDGTLGVLTNTSKSSKNLNELKIRIQPLFGDKKSS